MTKDAHYKIGILILALCTITWMFLSNSWGAESRERRSRETLQADSLTATGTAIRQPWTAMTAMHPFIPVPRKSPTTGSTKTATVSIW